MGLSYALKDVQQYPWTLFSRCWWFPVSQLQEPKVFLDIASYSLGATLCSFEDHCFISLDSHKVFEKGYEQNQSHLLLFGVCRHFPTSSNPRPVDTRSLYLLQTGQSLPDLISPVITCQKVARSYKCIVMSWLFFFLFPPSCFS